MEKNDYLQRENDRMSIDVHNLSKEVQSFSEVKVKFQMQVDSLTAKVEKLKAKRG